MYCGLFVLPGTTQRSLNTGINYVDKHCPTTVYYIIEEAITMRELNPRDNLIF